MEDYDSEINTNEATMQPNETPMQPINATGTKEARGTSRIH